MDFFTKNHENSCSGGLCLTLHWYINITSCLKDLDHLIGSQGTSYNP
jgi:hypothetical protein